MKRVFHCLLALACAGGPAAGLTQDTPATVEAAVAAGTRQVAEGDFEGAVTTLEAAAARLRGDPQRAPLLSQADIQLAVAQVALDHVPKAVEAFAEALTLNPSLRLSADRFSPKVLRAFETARTQAAGRTAPRKSHGTALLVGGGVVVAAGAAAILARGGGSGSGPTFTGGRFGTPVLVCENGSDNVHLPFTILVEASNPGGDPVLIRSATAVVTIVDGTATGEIGFASNQDTTALPASIPARGNATVQVSSFLLCGNGFGDPGRFNVWSGRVTLTTSAGIFMVDAADRMRVNIP